MLSEVSIHRPTNHRPNNIVIIVTGNPVIPSKAGKLFSLIDYPCLIFLMPIPLT